MRPVPETARIIARMRSTGQEMPDLQELANRVERVVPECVGLSVSYPAEPLTFTLVSSSSPVAQMDALQYLAGGPSVSAVSEEMPREWRADDVLDEEGWRLFARGDAAQGVASTLSLPVRDCRGVVACVNLYASTPDAFEGHLDELAAACGALAVDAVSNADLAFSTRLEAAASAVRLAEQDEVDLAVGIVAARLGVSTDAAERLLRQASLRADVALPHLARVVIDSEV
jgi:ANTAR domain-containing protein